ncbi:ACR033Cp [Eremothecium gossypii ATCC 10895]|uniref:ACR033Cp n=1 Tax=Eremothecium gossypii (strain ATCC 10895 / CBS 109.51 / FGSC 9923 / NRRL Y-1056) TaxID=284811 RepID=Q75C83_EREGS|nr:ACR033Cp [Eremothecium gossypii ATCC 10895]AAS51260.1 ACR033Cp [Eremothecium gossypii ATCC 10895]AEY95551.1 FACR033Cp [Eremothecium gossypii FDAG1]
MSASDGSNEQPDEPQELSYDQLVDIIVNGKPVPNLVEVADQVHDESQCSESKLCPRKKPWESTDVRAPITEQPVPFTTRPAREPLPADREFYYSN